VAKKSVKKAAGSSPKKAKAARVTTRGPSKPAAPKAAASPAPKARPKPRAAQAPKPTNHLPEPPSFDPKRVKSGLNAKDLEQFRELLLEKRAQLAGDVNTMQHEALSRNRQDAAGDLSTMPIHMADIGSDNYEQEFTLGLIEGERALLREIDEALQRIEQGTYGVCLATGQPIGKARLKAQPWAKYCYEYMIAREQGRQPRF
jgi:RNA polymerase-binding protein DksA